jgi:hypothetical protein
MTRASFLIGIAALGLTACDDARVPNEAHFTAGMQAYLGRRGDFCVGKPTWPIDVTRAEMTMGSRNAVQMPVLEHLGLVTSTDAVAEITTEDGPVKTDVRRYSLTSEGQRYYHARDAQPGQPPSHDFCAARLTLDRVVGWDNPTSNVVGSHTTVEYTYRAEPAAWTSNPEAMRVFPMVARVLHGAGTDRLKEGFTLTEKGWVADDLLDATTGPVARSEARKP